MRRRIAYIAALVFCADHAVRLRALCLVQVAIFSPLFFANLVLCLTGQDLENEVRKNAGACMAGVTNESRTARSWPANPVLLLYQCLTHFRIERCPFRRRAASSHGVTDVNRTRAWRVHEMMLHVARSQKHARAWYRIRQGGV
jgi:hypothetical protein